MIVCYQYGVVSCLTDGEIIIVDQVTWYISDMRSCQCVDGESLVCSISDDELIVDDGESSC